MLSERIIAVLRQLEAQSLTLAADFRSSRDDQSMIKTRAEKLHRAHSHSAFGDHAFTYYEDFEPPPKGFDVEWGHIEAYGNTRNQHWNVYSLEELIQFVYGDTSFDEIEKRNRQLEQAANELKDRALDLLALVPRDSSETLGKISKDVSSSISAAFERSSAQHYVSSFFKSTPTMTRDSRNLSQGIRTPVHICALGQLHFLEETGAALLALANSVRRVMEIAELASPIQSASVPPRKIFIGHGRAPVWRELRDYIERELRLGHRLIKSAPDSK